VVIDGRRTPRSLILRMSTSRTLDLEIRMFRIALIVILAFSFTFPISAQNKRRSWLAGTWEGTGYQMDNNETWTMKLTVQANRYKIEYPSLKCSGRWIPISLDSRRARFKERIMVGLAECVDRGNVVVERLGPRQIAYRFVNNGERDVTASAILNRKR
jgi:hypothetical protein